MRLADLIKDVAPEARDPKVQLAFNLIYPDKTGKNVSTSLGTVTCSKRGQDDDKALSSSKFQTGPERSFPSNERKMKRSSKKKDERY